MCMSETVETVETVETKNFQKDKKKPGWEAGLFCANLFKASAPQFIETGWIII